MYSSHLDSQDAARLTVADILSTMGSSVVEAMTPTTLSLLDGLTGVPTRTTPTLTPTTLRNIEQTFMDLAASQVSHEREAGFVPPMVPASTSLSSTSSNYTVTVTTSTQQDVKPHWLSIPQPSSSNSPPVSRESGRRMSVGSNSSGSNSNLSSAAVNQTSSSSSSARRGGGRRKEDRGRDDVSEEELGKRLMRRERNKEAAARCRKRRLDHTMALQQETEVWEDKKHALQKEIHELQKQKEELEHLLESHRPQCKMMRKSNNFVSNKPQMLPAMPNLMPIAEPVIKKERIESDESSSEPFMPNEFVPPSAPRPRPTSLPVASPFTAPPPPPRSSASWQEIAGIAITTPSTGIPGFNFDSLMEGGTGLTPVMPSPSCGTQQQRNTSSNSNTVLPVDLSSPDAVNRKLVSL